MKFNHLDDSDLVDLYSAVVRVNHYDPYETPQFVKDLYEAGVSEADLKKEILKRMNND